MLSAVSMLSLAPRVVLMVRQEPVPVATGSNDTTAMSERNTLQSWSRSSGMAAPSELARWSMSLDS